jgi:hypothetical protein
MRIIAQHGGYLRQYLVDDKGTTLIVVLGVPPFAHENDAARAVFWSLSSPFPQLLCTGEDGA